MIDPNKFIIPFNYVLVKPEHDYETYQLAGKETGIIVAYNKLDEKGNKVSLKSEHASISGTVYQTPICLNYNARKIWQLQDKYDRGRNGLREQSIQSQIDYYRNSSVQFEVPVELAKGDKVYFDYMAHILAEQKGLWVNTTEGRMMLINYDMLIFAEDAKGIKMLNGYLLVENEKIEKEEFEHGKFGQVRESGLVLITEQVEVRERKTAVASVIHAGKPCSSYLDFRGKFDDANVGVGSKVLYDPRHAKELEFGTHQAFSGIKLRRIQRKDIYTILN